MGGMRGSPIVPDRGAARHACAGPAVDLTKALQIDVVDTGWFDAGIVNGQNKLVPAARITVKNNSDRSSCSCRSTRCSGAATRKKSGAARS